MKDKKLLIAFFITLVANVFCFAITEGSGLANCASCWWQRALMIPLIFIFGYGYFAQKKETYGFAKALIIPGLLVSIYNWIALYGYLPSIPTGSISACTNVSIFGIYWLTKPLISIVIFLILYYIAATGEKK